MATSIRWPPEFVDGRLVWTATHAEATAQLVRLTLTAGRSAHPFTNRESPEPWTAQNRRGEAAARTRIERAFAQLSANRRARLLSLSFERREGELVGRVRYEDLETGRAEDVEGAVDG